MTQRILILGATSAIAAEVARIYASRGARLHLVGRSSEKMHALQSSLAGAAVTSELADFAQLENAAPLLERAVAQLGGLDVALIAHGTLGDQLRTEQSFDEAESIFRDNLLSAVAFVVPIANVLEAQRGGTLGVITSVAGERGRPRNYTYGAAKGADNLPTGRALAALPLGRSRRDVEAGSRRHTNDGEPPEERVVRSPAGCS